MENRSQKGSKRILSQKQKRKEKKCQGSFTVEATLLMMIFLPLLIALIYMGFYQHDRAWIENKARTAAVEVLVDKERKNSINWQGVLASQGVFGSVMRKGGYAQVQVKGNFSFPGITASFLTKNRFSVACDIKITGKNAKKEIQKYRNLKRLTEG